MRRPGSLLRFAGKAVAFFVVVCLAWYFVAPGYNSLVAGAANLIAPGETVISSADNTIYVAPAAGASSEWMYGINGLDLQYGLLVTIALIAATPGLRAVRRIRFILLAFVAMFVIHVLSVLVFAGTAPGSDPASVGRNPLVVFFCILGCDLFPVLVWGALSLKYFARGSGRAVELQVQPAAGMKKLRT